MAFIIAMRQSTSAPGFTREMTLILVHPTTLLNRSPVFFSAVKLAKLELDMPQTQLNSNLYSQEDSVYIKICPFTIFHL